MDISELVKGLESKGWKIKLKATPGLKLKESFLARYTNLTKDHLAFLEAVQSAVSSDGKAYFICEDDFNEAPGAPNDWDCWETLTLEAAAGDSAKQDTTRAFWNNHVPVFHSMKSDFAYLAVKMNDTTAGRVFYGSEPEFEEIYFICENFQELLVGLGGGCISAAECADFAEYGLTLFGTGKFMSMVHKAYVFDANRFNCELRPVLEESLARKEVGKLRHFIAEHLESLKDPYEGHALSENWEAQFESGDIHEFGDFALTKYYDPNADIGLGLLWAELDQLLPPGSRTILLGKSIGDICKFDPGKLGAYFQSYDEVCDNRTHVRQLMAADGNLMSALIRVERMLQQAIDSNKGLYVTF